MASVIVRPRCLLLLSLNTPSGDHWRLTMGQPFLWGTVLGQIWASLSASPNPAAPFTAPSRSLLHQPSPSPSPSPSLAITSNQPCWLNPILFQLWSEAHSTSLRCYCTDFHISHPMLQVLHLSFTLSLSLPSSSSCRPSNQRLSDCVKNQHLYI